MDREKLIVIIITVAVISGALGLVLGGVFTRPAGKALDAEIAEIRAEADERVVELEAKVAAMAIELAATNKRHNTAITELRGARERTKRAEAKAAKDIKAFRKSRTTIIKPKPKPRVVDVSATTAAVREMIKDGVVYSVDVNLNKVRVDPGVWSLLDIRTKQNMVMFFSDYFDKSGSTGRVDVLSSRNDTKLATYGVWGGIKILQ